MQLLTVNTCPSRLVHVGFLPRFRSWFRIISPSIQTLMPNIGTVKMAMITAQMSLRVIPWSKQPRPPTILFFETGYTGCSGIFLGTFPANAWDINLALFRQHCRATNSSSRCNYSITSVTKMSKSTTEKGCFRIEQMRRHRVPTRESGVLRWYTLYL